MSRKRHHSTQRPRRQFGSDRSYQAYQIDLPAPAITRTELVRLIRGGEDTYLELKVRFSNVEKMIAEIIALANTDGGVIVFGVNDQLRIEGVDDPESVEEQLRDICAHQIQPPIFPYINKVAFDSGRRVVVLEVEADNRPHRTLDDRFYLREGAIKRETTREELSGLFHEKHLVHFEQVPVFQAHIEEDIDESLLWSYVRGVNPGYWGETSKGYPNDTVLRDMGLAVKIGEDWLPTAGGLMLFGMNDRLARLMPRSDIQLTRFSGIHKNGHPSPIIERAHLHGNLLRQFDGALNFIKRYVDLWDARPSRKSLETDAAKPDAAAEHPIAGRANYHRGAVIEALTNFIAHRDLSTRDRQARINIYDDSLEFINPAQPIELPIVSLRYGVAAPPNPRLKAIFTNRHYGTLSTQGG
ncbi:MAG TPA: putative DNA binding domain-containing protein, partial [Blastocatellia bacterium]|nr:putative DNA binding domain-containing protein [Blastocatellia bacterium]